MKLFGAIGFVIGAFLLFAAAYFGSPDYIRGYAEGVITFVILKAALEAWRARG